ncbi:uncharacterized protein LOC101854007 [Aplysia californica]|uniref:Uncharacterized protein LOC101854007 n=1 Tax=Aplysia californica TaxID=6500 RepID=A0ABM0JI18_APLCA|nr:uncharacterized protein LOC101854007 [Aplysia californica]
MVFAHRRAMGVSLFIAVIGVGLIVAAFSTDHWVISHPVGKEAENASEFLNHTGGEVSFGLFSGSSRLNYALGVRPVNLLIKCDTSENVCAYEGTDSLADMIRGYKNQSDTGSAHKSEEWFGLFSFPLYVTSLVMLVLALVSGLVTIGFTVFNVFGRPIETITGPSGLFVWNTLSLLFVLVGIGVYLGLFLSQLKKNVLTEGQNNSLTSEDRSDLDYSFYMVVGSAGAFFQNLILLAISGKKFSCSYSSSGEKEVDNGMILY